MRATGIVRCPDSLGRLVIPMEIRRTMNITTDTSMEIFTEGQQIILQKYERGCIFCGDAGNITYFQDKPICPGCLKKLKGLK